MKRWLAFWPAVTKDHRVVWVFVLNKLFSVRTRLVIRTRIVIHDIVSHALGSCDRAPWAKYENKKTKKMQQLEVYY